MREYGNPIGPAFEDFIARGKTREQIISGAGRTNVWFEQVDGGFDD
jgi:hypothetical protein